MNIWQKEILRQGEGSGGGSADIIVGEGAPAGDPAPGATPQDVRDERSEALAKRVDSLTKTLSDFIGGQKQNEQKRNQSEMETRIDAAVRNATAAVDEAERALAEAHEDGDGLAIAKAQRAMGEATAKAQDIKSKAEVAKQRIRDDERRSGGSDGGRQEEQVDTTNLNDWKKRNKGWYGVDTGMTQHALSVSREIEEMGVFEVGSPEYFEAVDKRMRQRYPDKFNGTPPTGGASTGGAPAPTGGQQRISASVAEGFRRMGINVDDPEVAKRMVGHRQKAAAKGFLPETPDTGRIITR